jgi:HEAT repeat protein
MLSRRKLLINILSKLGTDSVKIIGERISSENERWYLVRNLVTILGNIKTDECIEYIKNALKHNDLRVRKEAVKALANIGGDEACEAIIEISGEQEPEFRLFILKNIGGTESKKACEIISPIIEKNDRFFSDLEWKLAAIESLSMLPFAESHAMLEKLAQTRSFFFRRKAKKIAAAARSALSQLNSRMKKVIADEGSAV